MKKMMVANAEQTSLEKKNAAVLTLSTAADKLIIFRW